MRKGVFLRTSESRQWPRRHEGTEALVAIRSGVKIGSARDTNDFFVRCISIVSRVGVVLRAVKFEDCFNYPHTLNFTAQVPDDFFCSLYTDS